MYAYPVSPPVLGMGILVTMAVILLLAVFASASTFMSAPDPLAPTEQYLEPFLEKIVGMFTSLQLLNLSIIVRNMCFYIYAHMYTFCRLSS